MVVEWTETTEALIQAVYAELRHMAARLLRRERDGHTLQRTALAHEAFIRIFGTSPNADMPVEKFLGIAAHQMREILIDHGRKHRAQKRGGELVRVPLLEADHKVERDDDSFLALDEALSRLGEVDPRALSVVELKFFCGYTTLQTAKILDVSDGTVERDWQFARSWLFGALVDNNHHSRV